MSRALRAVFALMLFGVNLPHNFAQEPKPPELTPEEKKLVEQAKKLRFEGRFLHHSEKFPEALQKETEALRILERIYTKEKYPNGHVELAAILDDLVWVWYRLYSPAKAMPYAEQALDMRQKLYPASKYPKGHPDIAASLGALGMIVRAMGAPEKAIQYATQELEMRRRLYSESEYADRDRDLAGSINQVGYFLHEAGRYAEARPYFEEALEKTRALYPKSKYPNGHIDLICALNNLASDLQGLDRPTEARPKYEEALAMYETLFPDTKNAEILSKRAFMSSALGLLLLKAGEPGQALPHLERATAILREITDRAIADASEEDALAMLRATPTVRDNYLSAAGAVPGQEDAAYRVVWDTKAAVTRVLERRAAQVRAAGTEQVNRLARLREVRRQIETLLRSNSPKIEERDRQLRVLTDERDALERDLAQALKAFGRQQQRDRQGPADLVKALPPGAAFVDFFFYTQTEPKPSPLRKLLGQSLISYAAYVIAPGQPIRRIELGPAKTIEVALNLWRSAIESRRPADPSTVARLVWHPVAKALPAGTQTVYISPDGELAGLPWAALSGSKPGKVLLEEFGGGVAVVPHGPFLLENITSQLHPIEGATSGLVVGDVNYGLGDDSGAVHYGALPGTVAEIRQIRMLAGERKVALLSGNEATGAALVADLPKARFAHLATHGFYSAADLAKERQRALRQLQNWEFAMGRSTQPLVAGLNPLAFQGLALAGANRPSSENSGIVTGLRIADLPLENLHLCVLSACETGLGDPTNSEGVFGLTRAFHLAGCPNVVASLWNVNDPATAALMAKFYHEMWVNNKPPIAALRTAQLTIYHHPELIAELAGERGAPNQKRVLELSPEELKRSTAATRQTGGKADTKLWAAFVLSGVGR
jgi:CHAT domain-containing protein/tetratricopeptide (TPR) repeat protein